jgi:predicted DNA-binding helix-hairpin-helix protein
MEFRSVPGVVEKLTRMGDVTLFEPAGETPLSEKRIPKALPCITNVQTPKGPKPLMKTMVTTACEKDCFYCPFRAGRSKIRRETFKPDELAGVFDQMQRAKLVDGMFLSSGIIKGGVTTQDKIIDTIEIIRRKYAYRG